MIISDNISGDWETDNVWDHKLTEHVTTIKAISGITKELILELWMNKEFMRFVFDYAKVVSHTKNNFIQQLREVKDDNMMSVIRSSGIAWSIAVVLNNEDFWVDTFRN